MRRILLANADNCNGCLSCATTCSQFREGASSLSRSRIYIALDPFGGHNKIAHCRQCKSAPCAAACPSEAIVLHAEGYWDIDYDKCIGCQACVSACPFGAMFYDPVGDKVMKCNTCQGSPRCVEVCPSGALMWMDPAERAALSRARARG